MGRSRPGYLQGYKHVTPGLIDMLQHRHLSFAAVKPWGLQCPHTWMLTTTFPVASAMPSTPITDIRSRRSSRSGSGSDGSRSRSGSRSNSEPPTGGTGGDGGGGGGKETACSSSTTHPGLDEKVCRCIDGYLCGGSTKHVHAWGEV